MADTDKKTETKSEDEKVTTTMSYDNIGEDVVTGSKVDEASPDPDNGMNKEGQKKYPKEQVQNGDPRAYAHQDQRAMNMHSPGATNPEVMKSYIPPISGENQEGAENSLAGPEGDRNVGVTRKIQKGQEHHLNNARARINPNDSGRKTVVS